MPLLLLLAWQARRCWQHLPRPKAALQQGLLSEQARLLLLLHSPVKGQVRCQCIGPLVLLQHLLLQLQLLHLLLLHELLFL